MANEEKTNVMRTLEQKKIPYRAFTYAWDGVTAPSGTEVADQLGEPREAVFKTLVTMGERTRRPYVFVIPVAETLDLKKAAKSVGEKAVSMLRSAELLPLTGYVHGGCSPIGMKKQFVTVVDQSAEAQEKVIFSGGRIGYQVEVAPHDLERVIRLTFCDLVASDGKGADEV